jgi:antimicrobial peptide system SdpB family protein
MSETTQPTLSPATPPPDSAYQRLVERFGRREHCLIGMSLFRIVAGLTILIQYLVNYAQRRYLFGPDGVYPFDIFAQGMAGGNRFSVYAFSTSPLYFEICFHLGVVIAIVWVLGWRTRLCTPLNFIMWWSLEHRFPGIWDGGDNIFRIVVIFATFANVGAYFSLDARRRARQPEPPPDQLRAAAMLHNAAVLAIALQLCLLYGIAGLSKVQGETWRDGTALYYALRGGQYVWPGFSEVIYENAVIIVLLSYATVAFQVSFPFLFFLRRGTRNLALCISLSFHIGIMLFMGLISFSLFMMAVDLALLGDQEYRAAWRWLNARWSRVAAWRTPGGLARSANETINED